MTTSSSDQPPPGMETKNVPYAPVPAPVPARDRIGYEQSAEDDQDETPKVTEEGGGDADKPARRTATKAAGAK